MTELSDTARVLLGLGAVLFFIDESATARVCSLVLAIVAAAGRIPW